MIYVKRDPSLIPKKVLEAAEQAQKELEALPEDERAAFIKKKGQIWRDFARYLSQMSYGKCWYSESPDPQSFPDVDHFRPKLRAKRSDDEIDPGYEWLAFSWDNFRLSANRSNRLNKNPETEETDGKGDWFPLLDGSPKACWSDRCEDREQPVLLDPVVEDDVRLLDVHDTGLVGPSPVCVGTAKARVERSIQLYGLNLPELKEARLRVMREVVKLHETLTDMVAMARAKGVPDSAADSQPIQKQIDMIKEKTHPRSAYARAAQSQLVKIPDGATFVLRPDEF